jgi:hypothetical protein
MHWSLKSFYFVIVVFEMVYTINLIAVCNWEEIQSYGDDENRTQQRHQSGPIVSMMTI